MSYPNAPWTIKGYGYQTVHFIDVSDASKFIPIGLELVSVLPGKTIGGIYMAKYEAGSSLMYSELIVIAGLVKHASGKLGTWISHIYVDNPDSIAGGREIWGLPKEYAEFSWQPSEQGGVVVRQEDRILCNFGHGWQFNLWQMSGQAPAYSQLASDLLLFDAKAIGNLALVGSRLDVPASSPFAKLIKSQPIVAVKAEGLSITVDAPTAIASSTQIPAVAVRS
jgi:acetoacetate decarboxylase